jgi:hypothetical protein
MREEIACIDFICSHKKHQSISSSFRERSIGIRSFSDPAHYADKLKKLKPISCIIAVENEVIEPSFLNILKKIKKVSSKNKILLLCTEKTDLSAKIFNEKSLFKVVQYTDNHDLLEHKIANIFSLKLYKKVEGKSKKLVTHILKQLKTFSTLDEHFDIHQGISMKYPTRYLSKTQENESDMEFIGSNQIDAFKIKGRSFYWNGDRTPVLAGPTTDIFRHEAKLVFHTNAPPLKVACDFDKRAFGKSTYGLIPKKQKGVSIIACCGFFNSRIFDFYLHKIFNPLPRKGSDASFLSIHDIKEFPIPSNCFKGIVPEIEKKVVQLESLIKYSANGKSREIFNLKEKLNQIFFDVFNLNKEHIQLLKELYF